MFESVLVANRGEIAVRIMRTLHQMNIKAIAVFSDADADALHVHSADVAQRIGPPSAVDSYLSIERIINAALETGAEAIHPGYGFLAENAAFARACNAAGLAFIGPSPDVIDLMGDKIRAKQLAEQSGIRVVPGLHRPGLSDEDIVLAAPDIGFPLMLKPSAGGGGKGMRLVANPVELPAEIAAARREALSSFGDDSLFIEQQVVAARHIEIQIFADQNGNIVHLGERECSLQRRHQKIIEEAPSPLLDDELRSALGMQAVTLARTCDYRSAGTVEFITSGANSPKTVDDFFFIEMNTRLQVEHPVTELITGLDLVEWQIRVAAGENLPVSQADIEFRGHAIEARLCAEDPSHSFVPTGGTISYCQLPDRPHARVDAGIQTGSEVGRYYDSMLAKVITWGENRSQAIHRLNNALSELALFGVTTNINMLHQLLGDLDVLAGQLDTELVTRKLATLTVSKPRPEIFAAAALIQLLDREPPSSTSSLWEIPSDWRLSGIAWQQHRLRVNDQTMIVQSKGRAQRCVLVVGDAAPITARAQWNSEKLEIRLDDRREEFWYQKTADAIWLGADDAVWAVHYDNKQAAMVDRETSQYDGVIRSPMPGTVTTISVKSGDTVSIGQSLITVEAMKMEHRITAPTDGVVVKLLAQLGKAVGMDEILLVIEQQEVANVEPA